ncbi:5-formyltetrahydrofolate cyclo-ligase [Acetobacteraceae bacterium ESL0709]|nr:5-formyltetrahydrofolate cyclo-ligase [Acetobacteraceae bacterium ESL0697]MDF7678513.1 5-formyltetrahydrofolate cyclo-ligase [Acetobacteraceae bacterium ESL0709]
MTLSTDLVKQALRQRVLAGRKFPLPRQNRLVRDQISRLVWKIQPGSVGLVWPMGREIDLRPLCSLLHKAGFRVYLPYTPPKGQALIFRQWYPSVRMCKGRFGTSYPKGVIGCPDMIFVPLLAFDRTGKRLGYGGGYYDRTLAASPHVRAIGYGLSSQEEKEIPADSFDQALEVLITEREFITPVAS